MSRLTLKVTAKQLDMYTIEAQEERQMKEVPLKVLFNPVITPVDNTQVGLPNLLSGVCTLYDCILGCPRKTLFQKNKKRNPPHISLRVSLNRSKRIFDFDQV